MMVTDEMVEAAWAAIVGGDIAKTCFNASIIRGDLKTGLTAALAAAPGGEALIEGIAKTIWLAEFGRAFDRVPSDPWENQAESAKAGHRNSARKIIEAGYAAAPPAFQAAVGGEALNKAIIRLREYASVLDSDAFADLNEPNLREDIELVCSAAPPASPPTADNGEAVDITGWKLVPDDPTEEMWQAGRSADEAPGDSYSKVWRAMFNAAPNVDDCETTSIAAPPASPLRGITDTMIEAGAKVLNPLAFDTDDTSIHRSQCRHEARKKAHAILVAALAAAPDKEAEADRWMKASQP